MAGLLRNGVRQRKSRLFQFCHAGRFQGSSISDCIYSPLSGLESSTASRWTQGDAIPPTLAGLTSTCRRHDVDPHRYLTQLLTNLSLVRKSELPNWLPDQWKLHQTPSLHILQNPASPAS